MREGPGLDTSPEEKSGSPSIHAPCQPQRRRHWPWSWPSVEPFASLLFRWECPLCGTDDVPGPSPFCEACGEELLDAASPSCARCAMPVGPWAETTGHCRACRGRSLGFDAAFSLGPYQGPLRALCLRLKHTQGAWLARWLVERLVTARPALAREADDALIVPVPLHWRRLWRRGYNQSEELARSLAEQLGRPLARPLRRARHTRILAGMGRVERAEVLRGAFAPRRNARRLLEDRTVVLVDDVLTTGATCGAAARVLKKGGRGAGRRRRDRPGRGTGLTWFDTDRTKGWSAVSQESPAGIQKRDGNVLRIGTRGSPLARWQAEWVADRLRQARPGLTVTLVEIKTHGDRDRNTPLAQLGGLGLFTKEIQRALIEGSVDLAVHSLKDLPTAGPEGLVLGAVPEREDLADALIAPRFGRLEALPQKARVGTGSLRRRAQLLHLRADLEVVGARGNVETRLRQALDGAVDAVVLAAAGLRRLGLEDHVTDRLEPPRFLPAVGQGALGLECRADDTRALDLLAPLNHPPTRRAVVAERRALAELEGGCMIPLGAWGRDLPDGDLMVLDVSVHDPEGRSRVAVSVTGPRDAPDTLGLRAAAALRAAGAEELLR